MIIWARTLHLIERKNNQARVDVHECVHETMNDFPIKFSESENGEVVALAMTGSYEEDLIK